MSILNGWRDAWIKLNVRKNKGNSSRNIVYSEDNELIEKKLDEILDSVINSVNSNKISLREALKEISNRKEAIYPNDKKKCKWKYRLVINDDIESYHFELFVDGNKIIEVVANSTLKGEILDFIIKYHTNIPVDIVQILNCKSFKGTEMIDIYLLEDNSIVYEDSIYSLDLLNNNYSEVTENENLIFYDKITFSGKKH